MEDIKLINMSETSTNLTSKKKVLIVTDSVIAHTGFGKAAKLYIEYLWKLNKYEIVHLAIGTSNANPLEMDRFPWKTIPSVNIQQVDTLKRNNDPRNHEGIDRAAGYGTFVLDEVIKSERPQVVILTQDIWAFDSHVSKKWFEKLNPIVWVTLDSLPILPKAIEIAPKVKNYWSWASFATEAMHKLGHTHVKTVRGPTDTKSFKRLNDERKKQLRFENNISEDTFVSIFLGRNQLRKSFPQMLQGFKIFKNEHPNSKLLFHTNWSEGWDLPSLIKEFGLNNDDILTTYICKLCKNYQVKSFVGHDLNCPHCKAQKTQVTTHPTIGVNEIQLNEIYNLANASLSIFTSGGQELHTVQSLLVELPTLVTNYSCGEDSCQDPESGVFPVDWAEYREPGTQFIKASSYPSSIAKQLNKIFKLSIGDRKEIGKKSRQWALNNFSIDKIGKTLENFIDAAPVIDYTIDLDKEESKNPTYVMPNIENNNEWVLHLYHNILNMKDLTTDDSGYKHWIEKLNQGMPRNQIEEYFRKVAWEHNQKNNIGTTSFDSLLNKDDKGRVLFVCKESAGDIILCTSLFKSIKDRYPDWSLYVATKPEYKDIIQGNPNVYKWLEWNPMLENHIWAVGNKDHNGFFDISYHPTIGTQDKLDYLNNGKDIIDLDLKEKNNMYKQENGGLLCI
jgi:glycosyltransferase involved in cell wall biosynthesis